MVHIKSPLIYMCIIYSFYLLCGGMVFYIFESINILKIESNLTEDHRKIVKTLHNSGFTNLDVSLLVEKLHKAHKHVFINGKVQVGEPVWTVYNSFFFTTTLLTTIGYGNVTPKTSLGFIFTMFYMLFGIPLNMNFMGELTRLHGDRLKAWLDDPILIGLTSKYLRILFRLQDTCWWALILVVGPCLMYMETELWTFLEGVYYCFITLTTVGFGDYVAGMETHMANNPYRVCVFIWIMIGLPFVSLILSYIAHYITLKWTYAFILRGHEIGFVRIEFAAEQFTYHEVMFESYLLDTASPMEVEVDYENRQHTHIEDLDVMIEKLREDCENRVEWLQSKRDELAIRMEAQTRSSISRIIRQWRRN